MPSAPVAATREQCHKIDRWNAALTPIVWSPSPEIDAQSLKFGPAMSGVGRIPKKPAVMHGMTHRLFIHELLIIYPIIFSSASSDPALSSAVPATRLPRLLSPDASRCLAAVPCPASLPSPPSLLPLSPNPPPLQQCSVQPPSPRGRGF